MSKRTKKKNIINLVSLAVIIIATVLVLKENNNKGTIPENISNFAIEDTSKITKIFIADMQGKSITLERINNNWKVNGKYKANLNRINLMLSLLNNLEVKSPTSESAKDNVIKEMATQAEKIEIYQGTEKPSKVIYVGGSTQNLEGTYMALDRGKRKEKIPFVVHDPTFRGYLSDGYFYTEENEWRTKEVFTFDPTQISKVKVRYLFSKENSFNLTIDKNNKFLFSDFNDKKCPSQEIDTKLIKKFLMGFSDLQFITIDKYIKKNVKDSILHVRPIASIYVENIKGYSQQLNLYYKPSNRKTRVEIEGGFDKERYYGIIKNRPNDIVILQTLRLNRILWKFEDFKIKK